MQLPQPFGESSWPPKLRDAARALWAFHLALEFPAAAAGEAFFQAEARRAEAGKALRVVSPEIARAAYGACRDHALPLAPLRDQILAAARLAQPQRFDAAEDLDCFTRQWAGSHAILLARLAGQTGRWQQKPIHELARAFFLTGRLCRLPEDLAQGRLFISASELHKVGVTEDELRRGPPNDAVRRLLWRQTVRIRDAFAFALGFGRELSGWQRRAFRRNWLGGLYFLAEIERRNYDLWSEPLALSAARRFQLQLQALAGRTGFR